MFELPSPHVGAPTGGATARSSSRSGSLSSAPPRERPRASPAAGPAAHPTLGARGMIKYLGSKRTLVPAISAVIEAIRPSGTVLDLFSGTSRVGHALKRAGYRVVSNDHNAYAELLGRCYVEADREDHADAVGRLVTELNALPGRPGYVTETFCERSRFFRPENGARIDAIREAIAHMGLEPEREAIVLTALMEAADRVDSTTGVQMAYLKQWAPRAFQPLQLRVPDLLPRAASGKGQALRLDALDAAREVEADIAYLDPPYNQHKYLGNYHIWESLALWDKPEVYGVACKRVDCRARSSAYNAKPRAGAELRRLIEALNAPHLVVSFNDEGHLSREAIVDLLAARGEVVVFAHDFPRYVGAKIGIHNPRGERVGRAGRLRNTEHIFVATPDPAVLERLRALGGTLATPVQATTRPPSDDSAASGPSVAGRA
jgi:adenine-specific DNA-methyltransferase